MTQKINSKDLFTILVTQLSTGAWMQLGVKPNPVTRRTEKNLAAAKMTIGILESLLFKTAGNLTKNEDKLLAETVVELKAGLVKAQKTGL